MTLISLFHLTCVLFFQDSINQPHEQHTQLKLQCDLCGYRCKQEFQIRNHILAIHDTNVTSLDCTECEFTTYSRPILAKHQRSHQKAVKRLVRSKEKSQQKTNKSKTTLVVKLFGEIPSVMLSMAEKKAMKICDYCGYSTTTKSKLRDHMEVTHSTEERYQCSQCDYKTNVQGNVYIHIKNRHTTADFMCQICGALFINSKLLKKHIQNRHVNAPTKAEPMACTICNIQYKHKSSLQFHMLHIHSDQKPEIECQKCPKKFYTEKHLRTHVNSQHGHFSCPYENCAMVFSNRTLKLDHIARDHEVSTT